MSDLSELVKSRENRLTTVYSQFRLIAMIDGVEFGTPVLKYKDLVSTLEEHPDVQHHLHKIIGRRKGAGAAEWETV